MPEARAPGADIIVYVCPTVGCGNHFAAPNFRPDRTDLDSPSVIHGDNGPTHGPARKTCPDCRRQGLTVNRVAYIVTQVVPLDGVLAATKRSSS
jgi:hypothetical protein